MFVFVFVQKIWHFATLNKSHQSGCLCVCKNVEKQHSGEIAASCDQRKNGNHSIVNTKTNAIKNTNKNENKMLQLFRQCPGCWKYWFPFFCFCTIVVYIITTSLIGLHWLARFNILAYIYEIISDILDAWIEINFDHHTGWFDPKSQLTEMAKSVPIKMVSSYHQSTTRCEANGNPFIFQCHPDRDPKHG